MQIWTAVISIGGAVLVAIIGFWLALKQDERRWRREKQADLYIDLLAEAHAEHIWVTRELTAFEVGEAADPDGSDRDAGVAAVSEWRARDPRVSTRMDDAHRALLGARMAAFATPEVSHRFGEITACFPLTIRRGEATGLKIKAGMAFDALQRRIEGELGQSRRTLWRRIRSPTSK